MPRLQMVTINKSIENINLNISNQFIHNKKFFALIILSVAIGIAGVFYAINKYIKSKDSNKIILAFTPKENKKTPTSKAEKTSTENASQPKKFTLENFKEEIRQSKDHPLRNEEAKNIIFIKNNDRIFSLLNSSGHDIVLSNKEGRVISRQELIKAIKLNIQSEYTDENIAVSILTPEKYDIFKENYRQETYQFKYEHLGTINGEHFICHKKRALNKYFKNSEI